MYKILLGFIEDNKEFYLEQPKAYINQSLYLGED